MKLNINKSPLSPFRWKENQRPSIFLLDPHFRNRHKAGLIDDGDGLKYKQFGTRHTSDQPIPLTKMEQE